MCSHSHRRARTRARLTAGEIHVCLGRFREKKKQAFAFAPTSRLIVGARARPTLSSRATPRVHRVYCILSEVASCSYARQSARTAVERDVFLGQAVGEGPRPTRKRVRQLPNAPCHVGPGIRTTESAAPTWDTEDASLRGRFPIIPTCPNLSINQSCRQSTCTATATISHYTQEEAA